MIEIGLKTAEKNSAQTYRQTDTTKIMVTWPWTKNLLFMLPLLVISDGVANRWINVSLVHAYNKPFHGHCIETTTNLWPYFPDHPCEPVPEENFWTLWCKGRLTEADTPTIWLGTTPSVLTSAHLPIFYRPVALHAAQPTVSKHWRQWKTNVVIVAVHHDDSYLVLKLQKCWKTMQLICSSADAEFTEYEKDVLLKLPRKEYILYFLMILNFCLHCWNTC